MKSGTVEIIDHVTNGSCRNQHTLTQKVKLQSKTSAKSDTDTVTVSHETLATAAEIALVNIALPLSPTNALINEIMPTNYI